MSIPNLPPLLIQPTLLSLLQLDVSKVVLSPMPGLVKSVNVVVGQIVSEGMEVLVIGKFTVSF